MEQAISKKTLNLFNEIDDKLFKLKGEIIPKMVDLVKESNGIIKFSDNDDNENFVIYDEDGRKIHLMNIHISDDDNESIDITAAYNDMVCVDNAHTYNVVNLCEIIALMYDVTKKLN